jgi:glycosyltransferase involved in cell wall biosynthesis
MEQKMEKKDYLRLLYVVYRLERGGLGTWLINILKNIDRNKFKIDFLVHSNIPGPLDEEARHLNSRIIYCPFSYLSLKYYFFLKDINKKYGPYDIIHSHLGNSGFHLFWGKQANIPYRIVHSHTDYNLMLKHLTFLRKIMIYTSRYLMKRYATAGFAVSQPAAQHFGVGWSADPRWYLVHCGIDLSPFHIEPDREKMRREFGIPADDLVIGHVGRMDEFKNQSFILDIIKKIIKIEPNTSLILVGDGHLRSFLEEKAKKLGIEKKVIFTGVRSDVPILMKGLMDIFLFPSLYEGLPLTIVEAQAAGLPCVISDIIAKEGDIIGPHIHRLSIQQPVLKWAEKVLAISKKMNSRDSLKIVTQSTFNILTCKSTLEHYYNNMVLIN